MANASDMLMSKKASESMGMGSAPMTVKMKKMYDAEAMQKQMGGESPMPWEQWLQDQGYGLDAKGLVVKTK